MINSVKLPTSRIGVKDFCNKLGCKPNEIKKTLYDKGYKICDEGIVVEGKIIDVVFDVNYLARRRYKIFDEAQRACRKLQPNVFGISVIQLKDFKLVAVADAKVDLGMIEQIDAEVKKNGGWLLAYKSSGKLMIGDSELQPTDKRVDINE